MGVLRTDINSILDDHPRWFLYVRRDLRFPCSCFDPATKEGNSEHMECLGTGYKISLAKFKSREVVRGRANALSNSDSLLAPGFLLDYPQTFYCKRELYPKELDRIVSVEWDVDNKYIAKRGTPIRIDIVSQIGLVNNMMEDELSAFAIYCKSLSVNVDIYQKVLSGLRGIPVID